MKKKGSIIVIFDTEGIEVKNFLYMLSIYPGIENYELIIAYEKNEEAYVKGLGSLCPEYLKPVYYKMEDVSNKGIAYNGAAEKALTDVLIFLDMRIALMENCLDEMMRSLEEGDVLAVQPMVVKFHSLLVQSTGYVFSEKCSGHALQNRNITENIVNQSFERNALVTSIMAINRLVFEELRGFNAELPYEWMGREITMRITMKGYKNLYNHRARAYDMSNETGGSEYEIGFDLIHEMVRRELSNGFHEMEELLNRQIHKKELGRKYVVINFSGMMQVRELLQKIRIKTVKIINYSHCSEKNVIEFEKILPFKMVEEEREYIYFANNFFQIKDNPVWFGKRRGHEDLIVDLSGNLIKISDL